MAVPAFQLEGSGFTREQVEALTEFVSSGVATKEDIGKLKEDIGKLKEDIARIEGDMNAKFARLEGRINILYWMIGLIIVAEVVPFLKLILG